MSEFIGSRISLISKSDIRYVGTLHEINSENSTVALEQVKSFGTEGRKSSPDEEIPASDAIYEYIVFRGSDVKDLRIEEAPKENKPPQPQVPNDPAILGSGSRPDPQNLGPQGPNQPPFQQQGPYPPYNQYNQYQQQQFGGPGPRGPPGPGFHGPPPPGGFGGYPGMPPYGAPPGWYPPPGQGFPPGPFPPHQQMPQGPPGQGLPQQQQQSQHPVQQQNQQRGAPKPDVQNVAPPKTAVAKDLTTGAKTEPVTQPAATQQEGPRPPTESKPTAAQVLAKGPVPNQAETNASAPAANAPSKSRGIIPAIPQMKQAQKPATAAPSTQTPSSGPPGQAAADAALQYQNATQAATAAVAAAMAKLPPMAGGAQKPTNHAANGAMDNLTQKINEMRTDERIKHSGQPGTGGFAAGNRGGARSGRGGRGGGRGGRGGIEGKGLDVPKTDFDFESMNAKFNKQDLVKEAIASGSPLGSPLEGEANHKELNGDGVADGGDDVVIPPAAAPAYSKGSFFDNLSSEAKEREDSRGQGQQIGRELRNEERKRNLETFGLGSVEQGYRGVFRGRGRGRGRGYGGYGRGGPRGGYRGGAQAQAEV